MVVLQRATDGVLCEQAAGIDEGWDIPVAAFRYGRNWEQTLPATGETVLTVFGSGARFERTDGRFAGRRGGDRPGCFALVDGSGERRYLTLADSRVMQLYLKDGLLESILADLGAGGSARPALRERMFETDHRLVQLARDYARHAFDGTLRPLRLEMDARGLILGAAILRSQGSLPEARPQRSSRLDPRRAAQILDYIVANLHTDIRLGELARLVHYTDRHFLTLFRATFGTSPHQFLIARRIDRARELLATARPLAEIALDCGFASQQHFTTLFRRAVGTTPGAWRRQFAARAADAG